MPRSWQGRLTLIIYEAAVKPRSPAPTPINEMLDKFFRGERMSLRRISAALEAADHVNEHGRPFNPNSIKSMVERRT